MYSFFEVWKGIFIVSGEINDALSLSDYLYSICDEKEINMFDIFIEWK